MEGNNMVVEQPKKKSNALLVILMFLIGIGIGFGANYGISYLNKDVDKKENSSVNDESLKTEKLEITVEVKDRLNFFVESASGCGIGADMLTKEFIKGKDSLSDVDKIKILLTALYNNDLVVSDVILSEYRINQIQDESLKKYLTDGGGTLIDIVTYDTYDNTYNYLYNVNEKNVYEKTKNIKALTCPTFIGSDSNKNIFLGHECGGTGYSVSGSILSHDSDENNYLVHSEITEKTGQEDEVKHKVLWKFDKDLNFVSTEKE